MGKNSFEKRKLEFIKIVAKEQRLPKIWEFKFADGEDMRTWFNTISKVEKFSFVDEVNHILEKFGSKVLTDSEKQEEFLEYITTFNHIPVRGEKCFSDNDDMNTWYTNFIKRNKNFETIVYINLPEYIDFDLATIWPLIRKEFINIIKQIQRIPNHGECILQNSIDVRVIFDKLATFDKDFYEQLLLHLQTYNKKGLSKEERTQQLKSAVSILGHIPIFQEKRFSDGTDMFTWYTRYKDDLEGEIESSLPPSDMPQEPKKVNIYMIPNFKNKDGRFYTICTSVGEKLDLSNIQSFEEAKKIFPTMVKRGEIILNEDEVIESVSFKKGKPK